MTERLAGLADDLRAADGALALTGAGLSAASGIPTFRGADGIWGGAFEEADFHRRRLERDPAGFWTDRLELNDRMTPPGGAEPNAAHRALARLESGGVLDAVVTQNTDGLHAAAGSDAIELHGNRERAVCHRCGRAADAAAVRERARDGERPPACEDCGGPYRPDVVLFDERLPGGALGRARRLAATSDVLIAAGSSLTVEPAVSIPARAGGTLAVVNLEATRYADTADYDVRADVTEVLPALADRVLGG